MGNSESKAKRLNAQGNYGGKEFLRSGNLREINLAVRLLSQAVEAATPDNPKRARFLMDRGKWGGFLYERSGEAEAFTESVKAYEEAIVLAGPGHEDRPIILITYGDLLMKRYKREKTDPDLERAEKLYDDAVHLTPPGHEYRMTSLISLSDCLLPKFEKTKDPQDIEKAIKCCEDGIDATGFDESPIWGYSTLSGCHLAKYEASKVPDDLEEAFNAARKAVQHTPEHPDGLNALTKCHNAKFQQTQSLRDINAAIAEGRKAADAANGIPLQWEESLVIWGDQYDAKYGKTQNEDDLDNCIEFRERLIEVLCRADPARTHSLYLLCNFRFTKYRAEKDGKVLLEAISAGEQGVSAVWPQPSNPERTALLDVLTSCYAAKLAKKDLVKATGTKDLEKAISFGEEALKMMAADDPRREKTEKKVRALKVDGVYEEPEK